MVFQWRSTPSARATPPPPSSRPPAGAPSKLGCPLHSTHTRAQGDESARSTFVNAQYVYLGCECRGCNPRARYVKAAELAYTLITTFPNDPPFADAGVVGLAQGLTGVRRLTGAQQGLTGAREAPAGRGVGRTAALAGACSPLRGGGFAGRLDQR